MASVIGTGLNGLKSSEGERGAHAPREAQDVFQLIEHQIIPRMLAIHWRGTSNRQVAAKGHIVPGDIDRFAPMTIEMEADVLLDEVDGFLARGVSIDSLLVDLLAPTARKLGEYWEEDRCDFVDVTMGLWRLQQVMRDVSGRRIPVVAGVAAKRSALFSPMPGDQHNFGTMMIEEYFAQAGWSTDILLETKRTALLDCLAGKAFDIAGLTISNDCPSDTLSSLLVAMRSVSKNPNLRILIGGRVANGDPDLAARIGADGSAIDPQEALLRADKLVDALLPQESLTH